MSGLRVVFLDTKSSNPNHYIYNAVAAALRRHPDVDELIVADYGNALARATERDANFFLAYDGENLNTEVCRRLRDRCGFGALWLTDDPYELRYNLESADAFDIVFTNDRGSAFAYGAKGRFLPFGADPEQHYAPVRPEGDAGLLYDVFFLGVAWPNRVRLIRSLVRDLPQAKFKIGLVGNEHLPSFSLPFETSSYRYRTAPRDFARLANASRITLALHRDFSASLGGETVATSPPPRIFEVALAGSMQLAGQELQGMADFFEPGRDIATYDTYQDCAEAIRFFLCNADRRQAIAEAAQTRALVEHTYDIRVAALLDECASMDRLRPAPDRPRHRARVLLVAHNIVGAEGHGGIELYLDHLRRWLAHDFDVFTYSYARSDRDNTFVLLDGRGAEIDRVVFDGQWQRFSLTNPLKEEYFADLLVRYRIELVHFHHLIGHPLSLPIIARGLGLPTIWSLHDYDGICDSFNLLDYDERYCEIDKKSERVCDYCTWRRTGRPEGAQAARRAVISRSLASVDRLCISGPTTRSLFARFFPEAMLEDKVVTLPVPSPESATAAPAPRDHSARRTPDNEPLELVALGNFTVPKGGRIIVDAAEALAAEPVRFRVHGRADAGLESLISERRLKNVEVRGPYEPPDLPRILRGATCTLHLSTWPETFCIALSEAWAYGAVPIVADIGALGERVIDRVNGIKVRPNDPGDFVRVVREILADRKILRYIAARIEPGLWPTAAQHTRALTDVYRTLLRRRPLGALAFAGGTQRSALSLYDCGVALSPWAHALGRSERDAQTILSRTETPFDHKRNPLRRFSPIEVPQFLEAEPELRGHLDGIDDNLADAIESLVKMSDDSVYLRGWRAGREPAATLAKPRIVLVDASGSKAYAVEADSENRPDVAKEYRSESLARAGFTVVASLAAVRPGRYRIAVSDGGRFSAWMGPRIVVQSKLEPETSFERLERSGEALHASIDDINGAAVRSGSEPISVGRLMSLRITGMNGETGVEAALWLVVESVLDGERKLARIAAAATGGEPDVPTEIDVGDLPAGVYRLSLAQLRGARIAFSNAAALVDVSDDR